MYEYNATIVSVVDGDTAHLDVDLGLDTSQRITVRFYGINAPETSTPAGKDVRTILREKLPVGCQVRILTYKDKREKYGRYLATILLGDLNINAWLVENGYAVVNFYK